MDDFRLILILAGAIGIGGLLWHGLWSLRRQQSGDLGKEKPLAELYKEQQKRDDEGFDAHGVGEIRSVSGGESERKEPSLGEATGTVEELAEPSISTVEEPEQVEFQLEQPEMPKPVKKEAPKVEPEPEAPAKEPLGEPEQVLILTVVAAPGDSLQGADLLPSLLTLGFKYGDMGIFHRHEDSAGQGPALFSLANMVKPGTFDVDHMETFSTSGVSLFMTLPNAGDAPQTFNMMLNAAQKLARELKAQVLDDTRSVLTNQKIRHYQERIREFERQKLLANSEA